VEKIVVSTNELLHVVEKNLKKHKTEYEEALTGWRFQQAAKLQEAVNVLHDTGDVPLQVLLPKPTSYADQYERAICILKMSVNQEFTLDEQQFDAWVMDKWGWKQQFAMLSGAYK